MIKRNRQQIFNSFTKRADHREKRRKLRREAELQAAKEAQQSFMGTFPDNTKPKKESAPKREADKGHMMGVYYK